MAKRKSTPSIENTPFIVQSGGADFNQIFLILQSPLTSAQHIPAKCAGEGAQ
jgi:hypothetical protein